MKVKQLFEEKQVGTLYHFTDLYKCIQIFSVNYLKRSPLFHYISFTRSRLFSNFARQMFNPNDLTVCIEIDGNKLSQKYKVEPYNYFSTQNYYDNSKLPEWDEMEERIKTEKIEGLAKYVKRIYIQKVYSNYNELLKTLKLYLEKYPWINIIEE